MVHISYLPKQHSHNFKDILQHYISSDGIVAPISQVCTIIMLSKLHTVLQK